MRPGDPVLLRRAALLHGVRTCYPLLRDRLGVAFAGGRLQALPRLPRCVDSADRRDGPPREVAAVWPKAGNSASRTRRRRSRCRWATASASPSGRSRSVGRLVSLEHPHEIEARHGVRPRDLLAVDGRLERGAYRRRDRRHRDGSRSDHALPGRGTAGRRRAFITVNGTLPTMREIEAPTPNPEVKELIAKAARAEAGPVGAGAKS